MKWLNGRDATLDTAQEFLDEVFQHNKPRTVVLYQAGLKHYLVEIGYKANDIYFDAVSPEAALPEWHPVETVTKLINEAPNPLLKAVIAVLFDTGMRVGEMLKLDYKDVDWSNGFVTVMGKGSLPADVPIYEKALDYLREYLKWRFKKVKLPSETMLFPYDYYDIWRMLRVYGKKQGVKLRPHILRHSRASQLRLLGYHLDDIGALLRHRNPATTQMYAHIRPIDLKKKLVPGV